MTTPQIAVDIVGRDKTAKGIKASEKSFGGMAKKTEGLAKESGFSSLEKQAKGFSRLAKTGFGLGAAKRDFAEIAGQALKLGDATSKFTAQAAASSGELGSVLGALSKFGGPIGMTIGAVTALAAGVWMAGQKFADMGAGIGRTSKSLGIQARDLQTTRASAERYGVSVETTDGALESLGDTLHDARFGKNAMAVGVMQQLGVQLKLTKDGAEDVQGTLYDLADAIAKIQNVKTQKSVADVFGLGGMLPALRQGSGALKAEAADFAKSGALVTDSDIDKAQDLYRRGTKFRQDNIGAFTNFVGSKAMAGADAEMGAMQGLMDKFRNFANDVPKDLPHVLSNLRQEAQDLRDKGLRAAAAGAKDFASAAEAAVAKLQAMGWTRAQAIGMAANLQRESHFDPRAIGDHGAAVGVAQWHKSRQDDFKKWAGHDIRSATFDEQLAFMHYELTQGSERAAGQRLRGAMTPAEAGAIVSRFYERPSFTEKEAAERGALAQGLAAQLGPQKVEVEVSFKNLPPGAVARTTSAPGVSARAKVTRAMDHAG